MKTEASEYISLLDEIQNQNITTFAAIPTTEARFEIDTNTRKIKIPADFSFLGVRNDHKAETIYFEVDRYFDNEDLSQHTCVIQFVNKNSNATKSGTYVVNQMDIDSVSGKIIFGWEIEKDCTKYSGDITFSVRFYTTEAGSLIYSFNTLTATSRILDGLEVEEIVDITPNVGGSTGSSGGSIDSTIVNNLNKKISSLENNMNEVFQSVSNGKTLVASAITDKGVETANDATFQTMADNIAQIKSDSAIQTLKSTSILLGLIVKAPTQYYVNNKEYTLTTSVTVN